MEAFTECKNYDDYLTVIKDYLSSSNPKIYDDNIDGLSFLNMIKDSNDQKRIISVYRLIDCALSYKPTKNNEMYKKINYLLSVGILFHGYKEYIEDLNANQLFVLIFGKYSRVDKKGKLLLPIFSNKELLNVIIHKYDEDISNKNYNVFGVSDYFFMIEEYYNNNPFDTTDDRLVKKFINEIILRIQKNTLHDSVQNMLEYWESEEVNKAKRSVL